MVKKIAFIFPGQGAQVVGMGKDLYENFESAKKVFNTADKVLGKSITKLCFEGPDEDLKQTVNTQPAIVTMSIAALETFKSLIDIKPSFQKRADLMSQVKGGTMAAVISAPAGSIEKALKEASSVGYVDVANYNSPVQVVLTGDEKAVAKAGEVLTEAGAKRFVPLAVSGAFHSKFLENASSEFASYIANEDLSSASIPVITNVDASEDFRNKMPRQICSSVHWTQTIENMVQNGVDTFIEIGPGKVLAGLNKKINAEVKTYNIFDKESLEKTVAELKSELCEV